MTAVSSAVTIHVRAPLRSAQLGWGVALGLALYVAIQTVLLWRGGMGGWYGAMDYSLYMDATRRWLDGGTFYPAPQLAGPYPLEWGAILYPPQMLLLFIPFTVLPAALWWAAPIGITVAVLAWHRPGPWTIVAMLAPAALVPLAFAPYISGTPTIWFVAFAALATRWPTASALIWLKPALLPLALIGIRSRGWWAIVAVGATSTALMWPLVSDWLLSLRNATGPLASPLYAVENLGPLSVPLLAWAGSRIRQSRPLRQAG